MKLNFTDKFYERVVIFLAVCISVAAAYYSYTHNIMVAYNDAAAHLNTARRMIDNLTPGLVQIGSVWLPLLHLAELPFVSNTFLWKTGLAGWLVSGISFVAATYFLYKLTFFVTEKKLAAWAAVLVFVTNLNLLYVQTTAMFEPMLMATALGASYFLARWLKDKTINYIVLAAFFIMLATLTRYDGWALFIASIGVIFLGSFFGRHQKGKGREGALVLFLFLAGFGIFLWLLYNQMIFGDALYFANSEFSARAQQAILEERGQLPSKHNLPFSFMAYSLAMILNNGIIVVGMFVVGLLAYLATAWKKPMFLAPLLLVVPFFFNVATLFQGQSVIWMPMLPPYFDTYFNARYGLLMLPGIAFFSGYLVSKSKWLIGLVVLIVGLQTYLFLNPSVLPLFGEKIGIITLQDTVSSINPQTVAAGKFLREHHDGKLVMVSSASADAFIFRAGIPLKNFITEGTGHYWKNSLEDPRRHAGWLVFFNDHSDRVGKVMGKSQIVQDHYTKVYSDQTYQIWKIKDVQP